MSERVARALFVFAAAACFAIALAFRLPHLSQRPMHGDEANQAVRAGELLEGKGYRYDPSDHHGPALYYAALPFCRLQGSTFAETDERAYRMVPVVFSLCTMLLMAGLRRELGAPATLVSLLLYAVSPAFVFFNRFFIQETMFTCFLFGMFFAALKKRPILFGVFAGLAIASKETFVLSFAAAGVSLAVCFAAGLREDKRKFWRDVSLAAGVALGVTVLFYSSFFTHWAGVKDFFCSTASSYLHRATAVPEHRHPWWFYFKTLFFFKYGRGPLFGEFFLIPLAIVSSVFAWIRKGGWPVRFLSVYTLALIAIYCAIPYKTPWCGLSFIHGLIVLAACTLRVPGTPVFQGIECSVLLITLLSHARQTVLSSFKYFCDVRNPYVYAHTGTDCMNLVEAIERAAPEKSARIALAVPPEDVWPLPFYLRKYRQAGYWTDAKDVPESFRPEILIVSSGQADVAEKRFGKGMQEAFYGVRPGVLVNLFTPRR